MLGKNRQSAENDVFTDRGKGDMTVIRRLRRTDKHAFVSLLLTQFCKMEALNKEDYAFLRKKMAKRFLRCIQGILKKNLTIYIALDSEKTMIGYVVIQWLRELWADTPEGFISSLYVHQDWRRQGIGKQLLHAAIQIAKKRSSARLWLENNRSNPIYEAEFYKKESWKENELIAVFEYSLNI